MAAEVAEVRAQIDGAGCGGAPCGRNAAATHAGFIGSLFERHNKVLLWYLTNLVPTADEAADVAQEAYLRLLNVEDLDEDGARARSYLFKTATNLALDGYRRRKSRREHLHSAIESIELESGDPGLDGLVDTQRFVAVVRTTLAGVGPRARTAFVMHWYKDMSYREIAGQLGVSKKTVERDITLTLELCRSRLEALASA